MEGSIYSKALCCAFASQRIAALPQPLQPRKNRKSHPPMYMRCRRAVITVLPNCLLNTTAKLVGQSWYRRIASIAYETIVRKEEFPVWAELPMPGYPPEETSAL